MPIRFLVCLAVLLCTAFSGSLRAQVREGVIETAQLQALLSVINSELRSDLDQVLVLQEAIKANSQNSLEAQGRSPDVIMFEDAAATQRRAIQRETAINERLDAILARSAVLDSAKQPLLERVRELVVVPEASSR